MTLSLYGVGVALAAAVWLALVFGALKGHRQDPAALGLFVLPLSFVGARLFFCLARFEFVFFEMGWQFALATWNGGFLMWGMLLGGVLGVYLATRRAGTGFASTLNQVAVPTAAAIAILRLSEYFTTEGRGLWLEEDSFFCRFPFAVGNEYGEWQLAVFLWEAAIALVILCVLLKQRSSGGDSFVLLLLLYSAAQIVLESLRADSCPRIGFVRVSQVLSAIALLVCVFLRNHRLGGRRTALWKSGVVIVCMTAAGLLEWALDKTSLSIPICYALMCAAVALALWMGLPRKKEVEE